jgi:isoquinoline 1-oxidoreductase beta subunit
VFDTGRLAGVLRLAAERAGWTTSLPAGRARGIAGHFTFGSYAAHVAEVSRVSGGVRVDRIVVAVDCGRVVNPSLITQQIAGGLIWALAQASIPAPEWEIGVPRARSFRSLGLPLLGDTPDFTIHLVPSTAPVGGVSGLGTTVLAPAVANAIFAAAGYRMRSLPFDPMAEG